MRATTHSLLSILCLASSARQLHPQPPPPPPAATGVTMAPLHHHRRAQAEGSECSPEGQWNCMPDSWQRCASGRWSPAMDLAEGTACTPQGLVDDVTIEHDGSVNGDGDGDDDGDGGDSFSGASRGSMGMCLVLTVSVAWAQWYGTPW